MPMVALSDCTALPLMISTANPHSQFVLLSKRRLPASSSSHLQSETRRKERNEARNKSGEWCQGSAPADGAWAPALKASSPSQSPHHLWDPHFLCPEGEVPVPGGSVPVRGSLLWAHGTTCTVESQENTNPCSITPNHLHPLFALVGAESLPTHLGVGLFQKSTLLFAKLTAMANPQGNQWFCAGLEQAAVRQAWDCPCNRENKTTQSCTHSAITFYSVHRTMQGSLGKAVCDHLIRDTIKMYTHKGAQLRLRGQHYSFSFSFFFYSAWFHCNVHGFVPFYL